MKLYNLLSIFRTTFDRGHTCRILLYHRVADVKDDPHLLSVSVHNFKNQIAWLKKNFQILPLLTLVEHIKSNTLNSKSICITFDDGYADNFYNALPILKQFQVPATVFITSGMIGKKNPFYWDTNTNKNDQGRTLNNMELIKLAKGSLIEIGSHTVTHPHLTDLSIMDQEREIAESKVKLENIIKQSVKSISYPFGTKKDFNKKTIELVKTNGYSYACANIPDQTTKYSNPYALPRYIVRNWPIEVFVHKMKQII